MVHLYLNVQARFHRKINIQNNDKDIILNDNKLIDKSYYEYNHEDDLIY
jgi:hypothetical protein